MHIFFSWSKNVYHMFYWKKKHWYCICNKSIICSEGNNISGSMADNMLISSLSCAILTSLQNNCSKLFLSIGDIIVDSAVIMENDSAINTEKSQMLQKHNQNNIPHNSAASHVWFFLLKRNDEQFITAIKICDKQIYGLFNIALVISPWVISSLMTCLYQNFMLITWAILEVRVMESKHFISCRFIIFSPNYPSLPPAV